jgi:hypothetical protein
MGGKSKPPAAPDYVGAATEQARASERATTAQNFANRPTINTPFGTQSWQTASTLDPATNQQVTSWTQNTTLAPELQSALNDQFALQAGRSQLAGDFMSRVGQEYGQPFDWQSLPQRAQMTNPATLNTQLADYTPGLSTDVNQQGVVRGFGFGGPQMSVPSMQNQLQRGVQQEGVQRGLNFGDNPAIPQFDSSYRDRVAQSLMERMVPVQERQQQQLETQLANQGFGIGSEGYTRALADLQQRQAAERFNALDMAGQEAQRLFNMGMGARQQATQEDIAGGQFANAAAQQAFGQGLQAGGFTNQATQQAFQQALGAGQFGNQAQNQLFNQMMGQAELANRAGGQAFQQDLAAQQFRNQALGQAGALDMQRMNAMNQALAQQQGLQQNFANFQNALRQQAIAEQMQRRGMSLNEMNALLSGQQVQMPQMPSFNAAGRAETPNILGATQMGYDAALGAYNAQQAQGANMLGGLFSLGSAALGNPVGLFGFGR